MLLGLRSSGRGRSRGLCRACRSDLQTTFERGFCSTSSQSSIRPHVRRQPLQSCRLAPSSLSNSRRTFHSATIRLVEKVSDLRQHNEHETEQEDPLSLEDELRTIQDDAVERLERELGMPLAQAIEEDRLAEIMARMDLPPDEVVDAGDLVETELDLIDEMRLNGVPTQEIVKAARQAFGEGLPDDVLNEEELKIYKRLYGDPQPIIDEDANKSIGDEEGLSENELYDIQGAPVEYRLESAKEIEDMMRRKESQSQDAEKDLDEDEYEDELSELEQESDDTLLGPGRISTGIFDSHEDRARDVASLLGGSLVEDTFDSAEDENVYERRERAHPLTRLGKFQTTPRTTFLPKSSYTRTVDNVMSKFSNKHLKEICEKTFGGPGLPDSPLTPRSGRSRPQLPIPLEAGQHFMTEMEANAFMATVMPPTYASIMSVLVETRKRLGATWLSNLLLREGGPRILDAGSGGVGIVAWREIVQAHWDSLHTSDRNPPPPPASKAVVLTGSDSLRHRAAAMLENTTFIPRLPDYVHTRGMPTLEDDRPIQQRKQFDVIIASHNLFGLKEEWERKQKVQNLWSLLSDEGGVLILIEKGIPRGFEAVAGAREMLLERYIAAPEHQPTFYSTQNDDAASTKERAMIIAPCTNHERCPMYKSGGVSRGRKDICGFQQRYIRPAVLQRVLGAKDRNHDDVDFSYLSVMKGDDLRQRHISTWEHVDDPIAAPIHFNPSALYEDRDVWVDNLKHGFESFQPERSDGVFGKSSNQQSNNKSTLYSDNISRPNLPTSHTLPRAVYQPMKRRGLVLLDLCTPAGKIERWTVTKSFSKQAYRDARKARWGDLWALGAKTRVMRNLKLGALEGDSKADRKEGITKGNKARSRKERLQFQAEKLLEAKEKEQEEDMLEAEELISLLDENEPRQGGEHEDRVKRPKTESTPPVTVKQNRPRQTSNKPPTSTPRVTLRSSAAPADLYTDTSTQHFAEWAAEYEQNVSPRKQGRTTKAARRFMKDKNRQERGDREDI